MPARSTEDLLSRKLTSRTYSRGSSSLLDESIPAAASLSLITECMQSAPRRTYRARKNGGLVYPEARTRGHAGLLSLPLCLGLPRSQVKKKGPGLATGAPYLVFRMK